MNRSISSRISFKQDDHDLPSTSTNPGFANGKKSQQCNPKTSQVDVEETTEQTGQRKWISGSNKSKVLIFRACALFNYNDESIHESGDESETNPFANDEEGADNTSTHKNNFHENYNPNVESSYSNGNSSSLNEDCVIKNKTKKDDFNKISSKLDINVPSLENMPARKLNMTYKSMQAEMKLLAKLLNAHGFKEVLTTDDDNYNLLWTGIHLKPDVLRAMTPHQRVNHFPRSYELTRKDRLYKNIQQMQYTRGTRHYDFIPQTYVLPGDINQMNAAHNRNRGPWIVKPVASSRGRGIYLVDNIDKIPKDEQVVVAKYICDPLLLNGHKCDLRLYVLVTSMDPLLVYLYEEGLVRLATVKYDSNPGNLWNPCIHLCNYSINKHHTDYVKSDDPVAEDVGHKRTLSALLRHLKLQGCDTATLMHSIEDLIIKSLLACTSGMVAACKMFQPHPANCFELFGFDILIDSSLKPWLLEVNLSPSLGVDSPLDLRVKASLVADLLTLVGIPAEDMNNLKTDQIKHKARSKMAHHRRVHSAENLQNQKQNKSPPTEVQQALTVEEQKMIKWVKAQYDRRGGFIRIFPTPDTMHKYGQYLDPVTGVPSRDLQGNDFIRTTAGRNYNQLLHRHLFLNIESLNVCTHSPERLSLYERILEPEGISNNFCNNIFSDKKYKIWLNKDNTRFDEIDKLSNSLHNGGKLTKIEIRKVFGQYLMHVLRRINTLNFDDNNCELVLKFLQRATCNLRTQYLTKIPSGDLPSKDRSAVIAKELSDFLYQYNRETEAICYESSNVLSVDEELFEAFLLTASEDELEELLLQQTRIYEDDVTCPSLHSNTRSQNIVPAQKHVQTSLLRLLHALPFLRACRNNINKVPDKFLVVEGVAAKVIMKTSQAAK